MNVLGLSCFYHDSAACLIRDGQLIAAVQEERFSRIKHDWGFPEHAIRYCLEEGVIAPEELDAIAFHEKPFLKFERVIESFLSVAPRGLRAFLDTMPSWLSRKLWLPTILEKRLGYRKKVLYAEHHAAHGASSFYPSPFGESAVLTIDGVGEWMTASYGYGSGTVLTLTHAMHFPNSLGLLYSAFTAYLGFIVNDSEYKVMGMAPYGKPSYAEIITREVIDIKDDGSIRLNLKYFAFQHGRRMFNRRLESLLGFPPRGPEEPLLQQHYDLAMSIQKITEEVVLRMASHVQEKTKMKNLCLAGGVALNCVANGRLLREGPFEEIFIQPAAGDAGGALGAAWLAYHHHGKRAERRSMGSLYLGPSYRDDEIENLLRSRNADYRKLTEDALIRETAELLARGKVIGWFQGQMEFGPRALGNRSILADPRRADMKDLINRKVKYRESFRPFAPAVPLEDAGTYFDLGVESPYMLLTCQVTDERLPAVTHVDGSARPQTVHHDANPLLYSLLREFGARTGIPVLLNTSLNIRGEPIACSPDDAYRCFLESDMDCIVLGSFLLIK